MSKGRKIRLLPGLLAAAFGLVLGTVQIAGSFHHLAAHSHTETTAQRAENSTQGLRAGQADNLETDGYCLLCSTFNHSRLIVNNADLILVTRPARPVFVVTAPAVLSGTLFRSLHASRAPPAFV